MKIVKTAFASLLLILTVITAEAAQDPGWPRQRTENGNSLIMYQPQVDDWKNFTDLAWRMAVSLTPAGGKAAVGVAVLRADTEVDHEDETVTLNNIKIRSTNFPSLDPAEAARMDRLMKTFLPQTVSISLYRLVACIPKKGSVPGVQLKNDPPVIFVNTKPSILLDIDGQPVRASIRNIDLEYVVNTHWPLFFDKSKSEYYLLAGELWLRARTLEGPWSEAVSLPNDMEKVVKEQEWRDLKKFIPPQPAKYGDVPTVFYSTSPAEVILFDGKPVYARIPGTQLSYARNTSSYLFFHAPTRHYYYLTAGRWFRAGSLSGPWTFATPDLPGDFSRIPKNSPAAQVLAAVPGTEEAKDAVLLAQVPVRVTVDPAAAAALVRVSYEGTPHFAPIPGTSLLYATNTAQKVIQAGNRYYLCFQGVWFVSASAEGPWQTAQSVPPEIYQIPPGSPVYNVTYVTQTIYDGHVEASYTAGYTGAFVMGFTTGAVIAGGTGYYYPPYVVYPAYGYPVYRPYPATYGAIPYHNPATGTYGVSQTAYGPYGAATRTASYNPYTGTSSRTAKASTAYGSAALGQAYNPYTGVYGATKQGSTAYSQWGSSVVTKGGQSLTAQHYSTARGTGGSAQTSSGGKAAGATTSRGTTAAGKTASGDMYAGHDGNVYRNTGSGWQKYENGSWNRVEKPTTGRSADQPRAGLEQQRSASAAGAGGGEQVEGLQREAQNRQRGEQSSERFQAYQRSGSDGRRAPGGFSHGAGRGGGMGGGRGRR